MDRVEVNPISVKTMMEAAVRVDVRDEVPGDEAISPGGSHGGEDRKERPKVRMHGLSVQDTHTHTRDETKGATRCVHTKQTLT